MQKKHQKWFWALVLALALASLASPALTDEKQPSDPKVAVVNGSVITQRDFDREMAGVHRELASRGQLLNASQLAEIKRRVLEELINRELLYQEGQEKGMKVDEAVVDEQMRKLKDRFPSEAEFKTALSKINLSEAALKSKIARGMVIQQFIDKQFVQNTAVSDEEGKNYYDSHPDMFMEPEKVKASHILIKVDPQADKTHRSQARGKLEKIQQKLEKGGDFAALAKEFSEGPSSARGGDVGYFRRGQMVKPFEDAAFALKPGEVSDIVETKFGYHLIKTVDKKPATKIAYEDIKERLQQHLKEEKVRKEVSLYIELLKAKATVETFLTENP